jgi:hypothetical protein
MRQEMSVPPQAPKAKFLRMLSSHWRSEALVAIVSGALTFGAQRLAIDAETTRAETSTLPACRQAKITVVEVDGVAPGSSVLPVPVTATFTLRGSINISETCPYVSVLLHDTSKGPSRWMIADQVPSMEPEPCQMPGTTPATWYAGVALTDVLAGKEVVLHFLASNNKRAFPKSGWLTESPVGELMGTTLRVALK